MVSTKTALITGGAKRLGAAMTRDLAMHGWQLGIHYNSSDMDAKKLVSELSQNGYKATAIQADLRDANSIQNLYEACEKKIGPIHLLVNNASIFEPDDLENLDMKLWDDHFHIHLKAPALLAQSMAKSAKTDTASQDRLIVNIIDQRVWALTPKFFSYTLSKSALWTATQTMAQALAPLNIRVNAIGPGPTLKNTRQDQNDFINQTKNVPLERGAELTEFGATIRYMFETKSMTGQMIALDGGQHLAWETPDVILAHE